MNTPDINDDNAPLHPLRPISRWRRAGSAAIRLTVTAVLGICIGLTCRHAPVPDTADVRDVTDLIGDWIQAAPRPANVIQTFNVLDYGAKCDGVTDDRAAIVATIAAACAAPGSIVYTAPSTNGCIVGKDPSHAFGITIPCGDITIMGARGLSRWKQPTGLPASSTPMVVVETQDLVTINGMVFDGNWGNVATTIADASNNVTLGGPITINVVSTTGFPSSGTINVQSTVGNNVVTYTGKTATSFTGCTGGTGIIMRDYGVGLVDANTGINQGTQATPGNHLIQSLGSTNLTIQNSVFQNGYGDGVFLTNDTVDTTKWTSNAKVLDSSFTMIAGNGVTFGGGVTSAEVGGNTFLWTFAQSINGLPGSYPARNAIIRGNVMTGWWDPTAVNLMLVQVDASSGGAGLWGSSLNSWKIEHNIMYGPVNISGIWNLAFTDNTVLVDVLGNVSSGTQAAPLTVITGGGDVVVAGDYFYTRAPQSGVDGSADTGAVSIITTSTGSDGSGNLLIQAPIRVRVSDNTIDAQNGHNGIVLRSPGGIIQAVSGTATATSLTSMTDGLATWTTNQFANQTVQIGSAEAVIASNTSTVLTFATLNPSTSTAWQTVTGAYAPTPSSTGAYQIFRANGIVDVFDNNITLKNTSGFGAGKAGIYLTDAAAAFPGGRVRIHDNEIKDANPSGIKVKFPTSHIYPLVDIYRNYGFDDQVTPTMLQLTEFVNAPIVTNFIFGDNIAGESGTSGNLIAQVTGLTSGFWYLHDGNVTDLAGFGAPNGVVSAPVSSTYRQLDGTGNSITWTKQNGTGTSGWLADALQSTAPTFTAVTLGTQTANPGVSPPTVNNGTVATGSTDWFGNITGVGATTTALTFNVAFATRAWCGATPNGTGTSEVIVVTNSKTAPTFSCFNSTTGIAANCVDFTYECVGQ